MKTIAEIREITQSAIEEREKKSIEACTKIIEDVIEPNILTRAKNGYIYTYIDATSLSSSQITYIINVYKDKGYEANYRVVTDDIEICWSRG